MVVATGRFKRLLHRRQDRRETLLALALVALRNRADAERMRRAHANISRLYDERGRELERLYRRLNELERERRPLARAA